MTAPLPGGHTLPTMFHREGRAYFTSIIFPV